MSAQRRQSASGESCAACRGGAVPGQALITAKGLTYARRARCRSVTLVYRARRPGDGGTDMGLHDVVKNGWHDSHKPPARSKPSARTLPRRDVREPARPNLPLESLVDPAQFPPPPRHRSFHADAPPVVTDPAHAHLYKAAPPRPTPRERAGLAPYPPGPTPREVVPAAPPAAVAAVPYPPLPPRAPHENVRPAGLALAPPDMQRPRPPPPAYQPYPPSQSQHFPPQHYQYTPGTVPVAGATRWP
ncbi:uncharacterized protein V1510DRAFT_418705 [Dipodascopsis tothii]|uniref:uncharacterized protein n=1 Tax=Dipodascopsis tothii TaxID=44089 RepID=UPI0034CDE888